MFHSTGPFEAQPARQSCIRPPFDSDKPHSEGSKSNGQCLAYTAQPDDSSRAPEQCAADRRAPSIAATDNFER